jgi:hypothetical protein
MTTQKNNKVNIDIKSQLAKLIATENITIQHNNVKTASFDTLNRILTLPIFKVQSGDVYDMLIAHECSHALYTPAAGWKNISGDDELRAYVNVLEDTRIDKLIQKKYPGVVKNYLSGFDIMEKQNFFGLQGKDVNRDLMLIDKINMRSKSMNRISFNFSSVEKNWLTKVDDLKTFNQVVKLAKEMLNWQKDQIEQMKKLPNFDELPLVENYNLDDDLDSDNNVNVKEGESDVNSDNSESSNDDNGDNESQSNNNDDKNEDEKGKEVNAYNINGAGGDGGINPKKLTAITDQSFEKNKEKLLDGKTSYTYFNIPEPNLKKVIVSGKDWVKKWKEYSFKAREYYTLDKPARIEYINWLKDDFKKFKNDNKKTVNYLVKEFEMKKSATAYKRATIDKTGVIDPLKLKDYKFSDDLFKRLSIIPNAKNHGMIMLLDWSGSMCDVIKQTIDQLMNLVWFCQKINIPYEVYMFTSELDGSDQSSYDYDEEMNRTNLKKISWNFKHGDGYFANFNLINVASHKMKKTELDESLLYLYHMGLYYNDRYAFRSYDNSTYFKGDRFDIPKEFWLGTTPLNEALVVMNKIIPMFKKKYNIEKMTFITLTDGHANPGYGEVITNTESGLMIAKQKIGSTPAITIGKKQYKTKDDYNRMTTLLLDVLKDRYNINTIGFYVIKRLNRLWELGQFIGDYKDYTEKEFKIAKLKKTFTKDRVADVSKPGYNKYFLLNGKKMDVQNADLSAVNDGMKAGKIKQIFSKSMKGRIVSRSLLNKFIQEVA